MEPEVIIKSEPVTEESKIEEVVEEPKIEEVKVVKKEFCEICQKKLGKNNESGFCVKCYYKSPKMREYLKGHQKRWYLKPENKSKRKDYYHKPEVQKRTRDYQQEYREKHRARIRVQKAEWARKKYGENKKV